jgi:hypothetical protein
VAEIILRLGCALVGWLLLFAHGILLGVVPVADCTPELWRATLLFALLGGLAAAILPVGLPWRATLRWLALPALPLLGAGALLAVRLWDGVSGAALCDVLAEAEEPLSGEPWQRAWAPIQLAVTLACAVQALRFWLPHQSPSDSAEHLAE